MQTDNGLSVETKRAFARNGNSWIYNRDKISYDAIKFGRMVRPYGKCRMRHRIMKMSGAFFALTLLIGVVQSAYAATVLLSCMGATGPAFVIKLDMDNKTVIDSRYNSQKSYPILITDNEINWDDNPDYWFRITLSRVTLNLHQMGTGSAVGFDANLQCHKSDNQF